MRTKRERVFFPLFLLLFFSSRKFAISILMLVFMRTLVIVAVFAVVTFSFSWRVWEEESVIPRPRSVEMCHCDSAFAI